MTWRHYPTSTSARYSRNDPGTTIHRRTALDAFNNSLCILDLNSQGALKALFSCNECELDIGNGKTKMKCIVIDGTATGILGDLPAFQRNSLLVTKYDNHADKQYILEVAKHRRFIKEMLHSTRKSYRHPSIMINIYAQDCSTLGLFRNGNMKKEKERAASSFFRHCFLHDGTEVQ